MAEQLKCDRCGRVYNDGGSLETAKRMKAAWEATCRGDGVEPRGIVPCPSLPCPGELILEEV